MRSTVISQLGFECYPIGRTLGITSPFTYCDDGEYVGTFIREVNDRYLVSDRCDASMNMGARGISFTKKQLDEVRQLLLKESAELNARGEVIIWATEKDVDAIASNIIRAGTPASTLSLGWHRPVQVEKFESMAIDYLYHTELRDTLSLHESVCNLGGYQITVPVTIKTDMPRYVSTSSVKHGGSWNSACPLLGRLVDLKTSSEKYNSRLAVIDSEVIGD